MSLIKQNNTKPELFVRKLLFHAGYRFRLHLRNLPGSPDIVLPKYKSVIFVNGCFWHQHKKCRDGHLPKSRKAYWKSKLDRNVERDAESYYLLKKQGWRVLVLWECEIMRRPEKVLGKIQKFLKQRS